MIQNFFSDTNKAYESLDDAMKLLCKWHKWIIWDMHETGCLDAFEEYTDFRLWLIEILISKNITFDDVPKITDKNHVKFWLEFNELFDKESLKSMEYGKRYKITVSRNKYKMVEA